MKSTPISILMVAVAFLLVPTAIQAQSSSPSTTRLDDVLSSPSRSENFSAPFQDATWHHRKWEHGRVISFRGGVSNGEVTAALFDGKGKVERELRIVVPDATETSFSSAAITETGTPILGGGSVDAEGRVSNFLATPDSSNMLHAVLRLNPFVPIRMCAQDDQTVWVYGWERSAEQWNVPAMAFSALRQYDLRRGQLTATLGWTSIHASSSGRVPEEVVLVCSGPMVTLFFGESGQLFQYDTRTNHLMQSQGPALDYRDFRGIAVFNSGEVTALITRNEISGIFKWTKLGVSDSKRGIDKADWVPVSPESINDKGIAHGRLLGASGHELVILRSPDMFAEWRSIQRQSNKRF